MDESEKEKLSEQLYKLIEDVLDDKLSPLVIVYKNEALSKEEMGLLIDCFKSFLVEGCSGEMELRIIDPFPCVYELVQKKPEIIVDRLNQNFMNN